MACSCGTLVLRSASSSPRWAVPWVNGPRLPPWHDGAGAPRKRGAMGSARQSHPPLRMARKRGLIPWVRRARFSFDSGGGMGLRHARIATCRGVAAPMQPRRDVVGER